MKITEVIINVHDFNPLFTYGKTGYIETRFIALLKSKPHSFKK